VGWRERDWARFNDDERDALLRPGATLRARHTTRNAVSGSVLLAACITGAAILLSGHLHLSSHVQPPPARVVQPPADVVGIRWRPTDLAPAANAGRICVTDSRHGRICAGYVIGERPADTLTREVERRGLRVQSSG
jgi:hypothetical protein